MPFYEKLIIKELICYQCSQNIYPVSQSDSSIVGDVFTQRELSINLFER